MSVLIADVAFILRVMLPNYFITFLQKVDVANILLVFI